MSLLASGAAPFGHDIIIVPVMQQQLVIRQHRLHESLVLPGPWPSGSCVGQAGQDVDACCHLGADEVDAHDGLEVIQPDLHQQLVMSSVDHCGLARVLLNVEKGKYARPLVMSSIDHDGLAKLLPNV